MDAIDTRSAVLGGSLGVRDGALRHIGKARWAVRGRTIMPAAVTTVLVVIFGLLYQLGYRGVYTALLTAWGVYPFRFPFLDAQAVLSAIECHRLGIDVYLANPCDTLGRIHVYSPAWLLASILPVTAAWTPVAGAGSVALFLLSLAFLPPGRGWWQGGVITLGAISGATAFAVERANIDIIVFVLAVAAATLSQRSRGLRLLAYGVALLAGMLKFYPVTLLILAVRERLGTFLVIGLTAASTVACFVAVYAHDLARILPAIPTWSYLSSAIGARDLPFGLAQLFGWPGVVAAGLQLLLAIGMVSCAIVLARHRDLAVRIAGLSQAESAFLVVGCALLLTCFLTAQNMPYRGIHFLFVLPAVSAMALERGKHGNAKFIVGCVLVLLLMWQESVLRAIDWVQRLIGLGAQNFEKFYILVWLLHELAWWGVATMLCTFLAALVSASQAARELMIFLSPPQRH